VDGAIADGGRGVAVVGFLGLGATFQIAQIWYMHLDHSYWLGSFGF